MTAPATLPAEVQAIVDELTRRPSTLTRHEQAAISAAFAHGLIEVVGDVLDTRAMRLLTCYALRGMGAAS